MKGTRLIIFVVQTRLVRCYCLYTKKKLCLSHSNLLETVYFIYLINRKNKENWGIFKISRLNCDHASFSINAKVQDFFQSNT